MKKILKYPLIFIVVLGVALLSLYLACLFPSDWIKEQLVKSLDVIEENGNYKMIITAFNKPIMFDTYADTMMMNTAYSIDSEQPFYSLLFARSNYVPGVSDKTVTNNATSLQNFPKIMELRRVLQGEKLVAIEYARYWHGYLIFLRPLLTVFTYMQLRVMSFIIHFLLLGILLYQIKKKIGTKYWIAVLFGIIAVDAYLVFICFEETIGMSLIIIESIVLLSGKIKKVAPYFFIIGMLTAFFDLLTVPVAICIFPLLLYVLQENKSFKQLLFSCIKCILLFGIGYLSMWFAKWILVDLIYDGRIIRNSINQILYRTDISNVGIQEGVIQNFRHLGNIVSIFVIALYVINILYIAIKSIKEKKISEENKKNLLILALGLAPIVWYSIIREHSLTHGYFTYRNLIVTCMSAQIASIHLLDQVVKKNKKEILTIFVLVNLIVLTLNYML